MGAEDRDELRDRRCIAESLPGYKQMGETEWDAIEVGMDNVGMSKDLELFKVNHLLHRLTEYVIDLSIAFCAGVAISQHKFDDVLRKAIVFQDCVQKAYLNLPKAFRCKSVDGQENS